ncbi:unnamed protein product [Phaedon cochleariae]|uniref:Uncharacterized protein n=1 Tax=Phaedon cochleariae TaxID=80249 RepID=A0A9N9X1S5_PHACE|nr:unnamed protein product [Phaedon cochleariae]
MERDFKGIVKLNNYLIYCSKECEKIKNEEEARESSFKGEIDSLRKMLEEKDTYIKRLKRGSQNYEHLVLDAESKFLEKLENQQQEMKLLKTKLVNSKKMNEEFALAISEKDSALTKLETKAEELDRLSKNMVTTIRVLERENDVYADDSKRLENEKENLLSELKKTIEELNQIKEKNYDLLKNMKKLEEDNKLCRNELQNWHIKAKSVDTVKNYDLLKNMKKLEEDNKLCRNELQNWHIKAKSVDTVKKSDHISTNNNKQKKVLIVSDQMGRGLDRELRRRYKGENTSIEIILKPGAQYNRIIEDLENLTKNFTEEDFVIISAGINDFLAHKYPSIKLINAKLKKCNNTNLIFLSTPISSSSPKQTLKFNSKLCDFLNVVNQYQDQYISFLNTNDFDGRKKSNFKISCLLKDEMKLRKSCIKNLVFIKPRFLTTKLLSRPMLT